MSWTPPDPPEPPGGIPQGPPQPPSSSWPPPGGIPPSLPNLGGDPQWAPHGAHAGQGSPAKGSDSRVTILLVLVVLAIIGGGAVVLFTGDDGSGIGPEEVVRDFVEAAQSGNCDRMLDLVTAESVSAVGATRAEAVASCEADSDFPSAQVDEVVVTSETDSTATVAVTSTNGSGVPTGESVNLVREDGSWKIDLLNSFTAVTPDDTDDEPPAAEPEAPGGVDSGCPPEQVPCGG